MVSRTSHTLSNFIWKLYLIIVTTIFPFIVRSMLVKYIGIDYTGVSSLCTSILQVLNMADLGFGSAIVYYLYKPFAENKVEEICVYLNVYKKMYRIAGIVILVAGVLLIPFLHYMVNVKGYPQGLNITVIYIAYLFSAAFPYITVGYTEVIFRASQNIDVSSRIGGTTALIMYFIQIAVIFLTHNFYLYSFSLVINPILLTLSLSHFSKKKYPQLICRGSIGEDIANDMKKRIFSIALSKLRNVSRNSFDSIVIYAFLGVTMLAKYQNYYQVLLIPLIIVTMFREAVTPSFGNSVALESSESNYNILKIYSLFMNGVIVVCASCLLNLYQPFMKLWMGTQYLLPDYMVILLSIYFYALSVSDITILLREATGVWWEGKTGAIIEAIANLLLNFLLVKFFGVSGVVMSTIITIFFFNIPWELHYVFKFYFSISARKYVLKQMIYAVECLFIVMVSHFFSNMIVVIGLSQMMLKIIESLFLPVIMWILVHCHDKEFKDMTIFLKSMLCENIKNK